MLANNEITASEPPQALREVQILLLSRGQEALVEMSRAGAPATAGCLAALLPACLFDVCPGEEPTAPCISSGVLLVLTVTLFLALMLGISRENN